MALEFRREIQGIERRPIVQEQAVETTPSPFDILDGADSFDDVSGYGIIRLSRED